GPEQAKRPVLRRASRADRAFAFVGRRSLRSRGPLAGLTHPVVSWGELPPRAPRGREALRGPVMAPSPLACRHPGGLPIRIEGSARCVASTVAFLGRAPPSSSPVRIEGSARCVASTVAFDLLGLLGRPVAVLHLRDVHVDGLVV